MINDASCFPFMGAYFGFQKHLSSKKVWEPVPSSCIFLDLKPIHEAYIPYNQAPTNEFSLFGLIYFIDFGGTKWHPGIQSKPPPSPPTQGIPMQRLVSWRIRASVSSRPLRKLGKKKPTFEWLLLFFYGKNMVNVGKWCLDFLCLLFLFFSAFQVNNSTMVSFW